MEQHYSRTAPLIHLFISVINCIVRKHVAILAILLLFSFIPGKLQASGKDRYPIIPMPVKLIPEKGEFEINAKTIIQIGNNTTEISKIGEFLKNEIKKTSGITLELKNTQNEKNAFTFSYDTAVINPEGYILRVSKKNVTIKYKTPHGAFNAVQTIRQLLPCGPVLDQEKHVSIPEVSIADYPAFPYRGYMLDVARHFFSIDFIKKMIDVLAFYKINVLHLHLNDDQGWRIEIKQYPKLNEIAAWRKETLVGHRTDRPEKFDGTPHGGYYSQKELKELVQYAGDRFITIIPEIDIPGHSQAILAAYPQLGCIDTTYQVSTKWGIHNNILCPTEETFDFLENVFTEIMSIFPSKYIHIGGDEVPKDRWKKSAFCQDLIKRFNLKDEHGLQSYFIQRVEKFLNSKDRNIIGWDEILEGGLAPNASVMSWRGENGGIAAVRQKHFAIMTPSAYTYVNFYQTKDRKQEPFSNGGFLPLDKVYNYNPVPSALLPDDAKYISGTQACLWTEYVNNESDAEYMTFPRVCALAEVGWTPSEQKNYIDFLKRLNQNLKHLGKMNVNFAKFYMTNK